MPNLGNCSKLSKGGEAFPRTIHVVFVPDEEVGARMEWDHSWRQKTSRACVLATTWMKGWPIQRMLSLSTMERRLHIGSRCRTCIYLDDQAKNHPEDNHYWATQLYNYITSPDQINNVATRIVFNTGDGLLLVRTFSDVLHILQPENVKPIDLLAVPMCAFHA